MALLPHDVDVHLASVARCAVEELDAWPLHIVPDLRELIRPQLLSAGKRLRPRLALAVAAAVTDDVHVYERLYAPAASAEMYHVAALILDDIEDNSAYRRGLPAVHTTVATSTAINVAATIRSLAYHPIHRSTLLSVAEKYEIHRRLDIAATRLVLGQSIDIGWHNGWYASAGEFPYDEMIEWKTGVLFGYSAWLGAFAGHAEPGLCAAAERFGVLAGALYQMVEDYLDLFDPDQGVDSEDLRDGRMTLPMRSLVDVLTAASRSGLVDRIARAVTDRLHDDEAALFVEILHEYGVRDVVHRHLVAHTARLAELADAMGPRPAQALRPFLDLLLEPVQSTTGAHR